MKQSKPKRYHKPPTRGCAWCRHCEASLPYCFICCLYPDFADIEPTGWCNEFESKPRPEEVKRDQP